MRKSDLAAFLLLFVALPAAAYDINGVTLGAPEDRIKKQFPSAHCKALEWASMAADRRCDDGRAQFGGFEVRVTFYLKKDTVEAFDIRFDGREAERFAGFLKKRYGAPRSEVRDKIERKDKKGREFYKVLWEGKGERAVLSSQQGDRRATLSVARGNFDEEIYRVR